MNVFHQMSVCVCVCCCCCCCSKAVFLRFILGLSNFTQGTLGTFPRGTFFLKNFSKLTPQVNFWPFLTYFFKSSAVFFGWSKSLAFLDLEAHGVPLGPPFWIFQKYAFLRPWRTSDGFRFFEIAGIWPFFWKICTKCCAVFSWLALGLRYGSEACPKVS